MNPNPQIDGQSGAGQAGDRFFPKATLLLLAALLLGSVPLMAPTPARAQSELQNEIRRREVQLNEASALIHEGDILRRQNHLEEAMGAYQAAYDKLPDAPATMILRTTARDKFSEAANDLTRELGKEGRFEEARRVNKMVREPAFNPDNMEAKVLEKELDDPILYPPAMTPGHALDVDEVVELLTLADGYVGLGDFDRATESYNKVLQIDRYNSAARRGMTRVEQMIVEYQKSARDHTRADMIREVDDHWETKPPLLDSEVSVIKAAGGIYGGAPGSGADSILQKLKTMVIPNVQLNGTSIEQVIELLNQRSRELDLKETDPERRGINFVLSNELDTTGKTVNLTVSAIPLSELLKYACQQVGARYVVEEFAIRIVPQNFDSPALINRSYVLPPGFLQNVPADPGAGAGPADPFAADGGRNAELAVRRLTAQELLTRRGVVFPPDSFAIYNPGNSVLTIRNTQRNIDLIELFVEDARSAQPRLVKVTVKVLKVNQIRLKELGFDWLMSGFNAGGERVFGGGGTSGNGSLIDGSDVGFTNPISGSPIGQLPITSGLRSIGGIDGGQQSIDSLILNGVSSISSGARAPGTISFSGVFTDPEFQGVMRALSQEKGVDFMSAPSVVVKAGNRATINLIREFPYPTDFEPPVIPQNIGLAGVAIPIVPATPTAFTVRDVGTLLEVEPVIGEDNRRIDMNLVPEISFFEGFINYGNPIGAVNPFSPAVPGVITPTETILSENRYLQPVFRTNRMSTSVTVYDGHTIVMGGVMTHRVVTISDKVPGFGDLPLFGRLFQSKVTQEERVNIIFFVHVDIIDPSGRPFNSVRPGARQP